MNSTQIHELLDTAVLSFGQVEPLRIPLVNKFYQSQGYNIKCGRNERIFILSHPVYGELAAVRLVPQSPNDYWLRNMLVAKAWRAQGLGKLLMQRLLCVLESGDCYCFALTHLENFYQALGFKKSLPEECNPHIAQRYLQYRAGGRDWLLMVYRHVGVPHNV